MRHYLLIGLLLAATPSLAPSEEAKVQRQETKAVITVGSRLITANELEPTEAEKNAARRRFSEERYDEWLKNLKMKRAHDLVVEAALRLYCQEKGIVVTEEEVARFVAEIRRKGEENIKQSLSEADERIAKLQKEVAEADENSDEGKRLAMQLVREVQSKAKLEEVFKLDKDFDGIYTSMGNTFLERWKSRQAVAREYGWKFHMVDGAPEPIEAIEKLLLAMEKNNKITYSTPQLRAGVLKHFEGRDKLQVLTEAEVQDLFDKTLGVIK
jgi:hypothetical protein